MLSFSLDYLLSFISSVYLVIILFCSFRSNSINRSLLIFLNYFLDKTVLPAIFIRLLSCHLLPAEDTFVHDE